MYNETKTIHSAPSFVSAHAKVLNLEIPFTKAELNSAFRKAAFKYHPDMGGTEKEFIEIKKAYDILLELTPDDVVESVDLKLRIRTVEGYLITNLGKGLGDLVNSKDCEECHAAGYYSVTHEIIHYREICPNCEGQGYISTQRFYSFLDFHFGGMERCTRCQGHGGFYPTVTPLTTIHYCSHCKGTGQIAIPNPALPKNRMFVSVPNIDNRPKKRYCPKCNAILKSNGEC
jgi:DnaJ-class molecular chaperone